MNYFEEEFSYETEDYLREIPKEIPPAIASILIDDSLENEQDYLATVANLISKGYIEIKVDKEENEYGIKKAKVHVKNDNVTDLMEHEKFAFKMITRRMHFEPQEFKNKVIEDAKKLGLIVEFKMKKDGELRAYYARTKKGKLFGEKFLRLKKYLNDYTLIKEQNLDGLKLYGEYIVYAIALGEADKLDKFLDEDYNFRNVMLKIKD